MAACNKAHAPGTSADSETHFLRACDADCPGDLQCICGVCSVTCDPASDCGAAHERSSCVAASAFSDEPSCETMAAPSVCDVTCMESSDCADISSAHVCDAGRCRATEPVPSTGCTHDGTTYAVGSSWTEDCNGCSCSADGQAICTQRACSPVACYYERIGYAVGDTFPHADGCNRCSCEAGGGVVCTERERGCSSAACTSAFDSGTCAAAIQVFWHNPATGECEQKIFGGCGGNDNRFETLQACRNACDVQRTGIDCRVEGIDYPSGGTMPDPFSCNSCTCELGALGACTEIGCETPCPSGTIAASHCAECGVVGGCTVMEIGCLPTCSEDTDCASDRPFCIQRGGYCVATPACF